MLKYTRKRKGATQTMYKSAYKTFGIFGIVIVAFIFFMVSFLDSSHIMEGRIVKIYDGDTITIQDSKDKIYKIRFYGIDAPELKQNFGRESRENLVNLCPLDSLAKIEVKDIDRYNRIVGIVFCNGIDSNAKQVESGFAWAYTEYSKEYQHLEAEARKEFKGLWSEHKPIKPSDYRKKAKYMPEQE